MSRLSEILNRIELIAAKMGMSIEDAVSILEGRHATHVVTEKYKEVKTPENPIAAAPSAAASTVGGTVGETGNSTTSGHADASVGVQQLSAGSTEDNGNED